MLKLGLFTFSSASPSWWGLYFCREVTVYTGFESFILLLLDDLCFSFLNLCFNSSFFSQVSKGLLPESFVALCFRKPKQTAVELLSKGTSFSCSDSKTFFLLSFSQKSLNWDFSLHIEHAGDYSLHYLEGVKLGQRWLKNKKAYARLVFFRMLLQFLFMLNDDCRYEVNYYKRVRG